MAVVVSHDQVRVEVRDSGGGVPTQRPVSEESDTGRGLHLIAELADTWGVDQHVVGKTVWFVLTSAPEGAGVQRLRGAGVGRTVG